VLPVPRVSAAPCRALPATRHCSVPTPPPGGRCHPPETFSATPRPPISPPLRPTRQSTPSAPSTTFPPPPFKGELRRRRSTPPLCHVFLLRSDATLAVPSLTSDSSRRTAPDDAATPPKSPSTGTPPRRPLSTTAPALDLLGEPHLRSPCPMHSPRGGGALTENLAAG
jgi:hypothetical protein